MRIGKEAERFTKPLGAAAAIVTCALAVVTVIVVGSLAQTSQLAPTLAQRQAFGELPVYFVENCGQVDGPVDYYIQGRDKTIYFTSEGTTYALNELRETGDRLVGESELQTEEVIRRWIVKLDFLGANPDVQPVGRQGTPVVISYFKGGPEEWHAGLPTYSSIVYPDLWPGIDLEFFGTVSRLKYQFVVKPGADPSAVRLAYRGATEVRVNDAGQLAVSTPAGGFHDDVPYAYQDAKGQRVGVDVAYALDKTPEGEAIYGFHLGAYDPRETLVLDPAVLVYCGYIGGSGDGWEDAHGITVDAEGNAYVTGYTISTEASFPVTVGPDLTYNGYDQDAFVAKVNAAGTGLVYCGYIGGNRTDGGLLIAVDDAGCAYVAGRSESTEATFPVAVGPDLTHNGLSDAFVAKVNASGTGLLYCGYIGGSGMDYGRGIVVDDSGCAYVAGHTNSSHSSFPVSKGPDLTFNGRYDGYIAKVNPSGTGLVYCGYIGGTELDNARDVAVDSRGNAYVTGYAQSTQASFPVAVGPDLTYNGGYYDVYVAKVKPSGTGLVYCGYIGGSGYDQSHGIALDGAGSAYIAGSTDSDQSSFPVAIGPDLTYNGGTHDAFVAKVNPSGTGLVYCGYIGGAGLDGGSHVAVDSAGNGYITGSTGSNESSFPVIGGPDLTYNGGPFDGFVAKVNASGTGLVYCGYIGGSGDDRSVGIAVDAEGSAYLSGNASSSELSFPVTVGPDLTYNLGPHDAFVAKVTPGESPACWEAVRQLLGLVEGFGLDKGIEASLISKLEATLHHLDSGNHAAAVNGLHAFVNAVEAQRSKKLSEEEADLLVAEALGVMECILGGAMSLGPASLPVESPSIQVFPNPVTDTHTAHFVAQGTEVVSIQVEIFALSGARIFHSGAVTGSEFDWHLETDGGGIAPNGVYLYRVMTHGIDGVSIWIELGKITVLR